VERADYNGVFAPNSKYQSLVTPARRGKGNKSKATNETQDQTPAEKRGSMIWAMRLKRVFGIDIETCSECGGDVRIIPKALASLAGQALASIEDPAVIKKILDYLDDNTPCITTALQPECRAPPLAELLESF